MPSSTTRSPVRYQARRRRRRGGRPGRQVGPAEVAAHHAGAGDDQLALGPAATSRPVLVDDPGPQRRADPADREGRVAVVGDRRRDRLGGADVRLGRAVEVPEPARRARAPQSAAGGGSGRPRRRTGPAAGARKPGRSRPPCWASRARIDGAEYQTSIRRSARKRRSRAGSLPSASPIRTSVAAVPAGGEEVEDATGRNGTARARRSGRRREVERRSHQSRKQNALRARASRPWAGRSSPTCRGCTPGRRGLAAAAAARGRRRP